MAPRSSAVVVVLSGTAVLVLLWLGREAREASAPRAEVAMAPSEPAPAPGLARVPQPRREGTAVPPMRDVGARAEAPVSVLDPLVGLAACLASPANAASEPATMQEIRVCIQGHNLGAITAPALARWLCIHDPSPAARQVLIEQISIRRSPGEFLRFVDELLAAICDELRERLPLQAGLLWAQEKDPAWFAEVGALVDPQSIFGGESDGCVLLAESFAGDVRIRELLAAGARGELGGTPQQMVRAASVVAAHEDGGERYLSFCESLLDSRVTTPDELMGCHIAHFLLRSQACLDGSWERSIAQLERVLDDPRFATDAAAQLLSSQSVQPQGFPDADWVRLLERARLLLER